MKNSLLNQPIKIEFKGREYKFQYDYYALGVLEELSGKGVYEILDLIVRSKSLRIKDMKNIISCAMLVNHKEEDFKILMENLNACPSEAMKIHSAAKSAFILPLLPDEMVKKMKIKSSKKKDKAKLMV